MPTESVRRPGRALRDALERVDGLSTTDRLLVYERLVAELDDQELGASRRDRRLQERAEALRVLGAARARLGLDETQRLTSRAFTADCAELDNGWNASRVIHAWGTWRNAADVLAGARPPRAAEQAAVSLMRDLHRSSHRMAMECLREWLTGDPPRVSHGEYLRWSQERNSDLSPDEPRYLTANGVCSALGVTFATARRRAQASLSSDTPEPIESYVVGDRTLITAGGFAERVGLTTTGLGRRARRTPLPSPLLNHEWRQYWAEEDAVRWEDGETVKRDDGALDETVLDRARLADLLGVTAQVVRDRWRDAPQLLPPANGRLYEHPWWDAAEAAQWRRRTAGTRLTRHDEERTTRLELDGQWLLTTRAVSEHLRMTEGQFEYERRRRPLRPAGRTPFFGPLAVRAGWM